MKKLTKYEQETILLTNQDTDEYSVFTCNKPFKRRLMKFAESSVTFSLQSTARLLLKQQQSSTAAQ